MPIFRDLISRYVLTPAVVERLKPDMRKVLIEQLPDAVKEAGAELQKAGEGVKGMQFPVGIHGPLQPYMIGGGARKESGVGFSLLREFSVFYWAARACISKRQEQIANLEWDIIPVDKKDDSDAVKKQIAEVRLFFQNIAGPQRTFRSFLDLVIEDLLVLDAMAVYKVRDYGQKLRFLHPVDGASIRLVVDKAGILAQPPQAAYQQWLHGEKVAEMTVNDMLYGMMNPRTNTAYGLSPLETLVLVIQSALHSEVSNMNIFKEGNIPEGFLQMPESYGPKEIKEFSDYWDAIMAGDQAMQRRLRIVAGGKGAGYVGTKKPEEMQFREFEEWLTIKTCAVMGVSPGSIGITWNLNKATADDQSMLSKNESVQPLANFLQERFDQIIQVDLGYPELKFKFKGFDVRNELQDAQVSEINMRNGVMTINEAREQQGKEPVEYGNELIIQTASGPILLRDVVQAQEQAPAPVKEVPESAPPEEPQQKSASVVNELRLYQKKALHDVKKGQKFRPFTSAVIPVDTLSAIDQDLQECTTADQVRALFRKQLIQEQGTMFDAALTLAEEIESILKQPDHGGPPITIAKGT